MGTLNGNSERELRTGTLNGNSKQELGTGTRNGNSERELRTGAQKRNLEQELGTGTWNQKRLWPHGVAQVLKDSACAVVHNAFFSSLQKKSNRRSCLNW